MSLDLAPSAGCREVGFGRVITSGSLPLLLAAHAATRSRGGSAAQNSSSWRGAERFVDAAVGTFVVGVTRGAGRVLGRGKGA